MKRFSYNTFYLVQILFFSNLFSFSTIQEQRSIPSNNLSYPVLINIKNRLPASGFYINNGSTIYLVTAKHVIFDSTMSLWDNSATLSSPAKDSSETELNTFVADLKKLQISHMIRTDSTHDAVVLKIGKILKNRNVWFFVNFIFSLIFLKNKSQSCD